MNARAENSQRAEQNFNRQELENNLKQSRTHRDLCRTM